MSQQSLRQASIRAVTSTTYTYEGDWHALWDLLGIAAGTFNERMLLYINNQLSTSYTELNSAMAAFAAEHGSTTFQAIGTFTPGFSLTAPVLDWTSLESDATPEFDVDLTDPAVDDVITLQWDNNSDFSSPISSGTNTVDAGEQAASLVNFVTGSLSDGTYYFRAKHARGASESAWSNTETVTILTVVAPVNTVAPVVTAGSLTLTTTDGTWTGTAVITFSYQWKRGVTNVGTDSNTYTPVAADAGQSMTCVVTGTNAAGNSTGTSNAVVLATNRLQKTQAYDDGYWSPSNGSISANAATDPLGGSTADKFLETNSAGKHEVYVTAGLAVSNATQYTLSHFFKAAERTMVMVATGIGQQAWFDLSAVSVLTQTDCVGTITDVGNGWRRCSIVYTSSFTTEYAQPLMATTDGVDNYTGTTNSGAYIWGAMHQTGGAVTTYVPVA